MMMNLQVTHRRRQQPRDDQIQSPLGNRKRKYGSDFFGGKFQDLRGSTGISKNPYSGTDLPLSKTRFEDEDEYKALV